MPQIPDYVRQEASKELARRFFYDYCQLKYPKHYTDDRIYLKDLCDRLQGFLEQNQKRFLVVTIPPRHYKSFTGSGLVEWVFGSDPLTKVMTGSYNETLSTTFARKVRDTIDEAPSKGILVYNDIFPDTKVKYGQASASKWSLEGSTQDNYLATSPTGTATGFGANIILIDDIIKNAEEAYSDIVHEKHWSWFNNTMLSRTEGDDWKVILIMTRWATNDLAGRVLQAFGDEVEHVSYKAVQEDGSMLCDSILNKRDFALKTKEMSLDIVEANYNQKPIDIKGRLYGDFKLYQELPDVKDLKRWNYTDTADTGNDWLCSVNFIEKEGEVYVTDVVMSDEAMEDTEPQVAAILSSDDVTESIVESNNGGRGFGRNIQRLLAESGNNKCIITAKPQTGNKEARILTSSAWVKSHIHMPLNWQHKWPEFYSQIMSYQSKGKNKHDDAVDVLAGIYETVTQTKRVTLEFF